MILSINKFVFIIFLFFSMSVLSLPSFENEKAEYEYFKECQNKRVIEVDSRILGDYRVDIYNLLFEDPFPREESWFDKLFGIEHYTSVPWKEHCYDQKIIIRKLDTEEIILYDQSPNFYSFYSDQFINEKYLWLKHSPGSVGVLTHGYYFNENSEIERIDIPGVSCQILDNKENQLICSEVTKRPFYSTASGCSLSVFPYDKFLIEIKGNQIMKTLHELGDMHPDCKINK